MNLEKRIDNITKKLIAFYGIPSKNNYPPDPLDLIIATILSQNTNDRNSIRAYRNLKDSFRNWEDILNASIDEIENLVRIAGLGKQKSKAIINLIETLKEKRKSISLDYIIPFSNEDILNELTEFEGVGLKTASCVLLFSLERNVCPVDTHVHRITNRLGIVSTKTPEKSYYIINDNLPENAGHEFHTNLIRLGREICKPKNPFCGSCPLNKDCLYEFKTDLITTKLKPKDFMLLDNIV